MLYTTQTAHRRKPVLCNWSAVGGEMEKQNIMMVWLLSVLALLQSQGELSQLQSVLGLLGSSSSRELEKHGSPPTSSTQLWRAVNSVQSNQAGIPFSGFTFKGLGLLHFEYLCMDFQAVIMIMMCVISALSSFEYTYLISSTPIIVSDPIQAGQFKQAMVFPERI